MMTDDFDYFSNTGYTRASWWETDRPISVRQHFAPVASRTANRAVGLWKSHVREIKRNGDRKIATGLEIRQSYLWPAEWDHVPSSRRCCEGAWLFYRCFCSVFSPTRRMSWSSQTRPLTSSSSVTRTPSSCFTHHGEKEDLLSCLAAYVALYCTCAIKRFT